MTAARSLVVVASVEPDVTDDLAEALRDRFTVRTAYSADGLLASLDSEVDVLLVDREFPGLPLDALRDRKRERSARWQVGLLTDDPVTEPADSGESGPAVPGVDAAVPTPGAASERAVRDAVDHLARRAQYQKRLEEYYAVAEEYAELTADGNDSSDAESDEADPDTGADGDPNPATDDGSEAERDCLERHLERLRSDLAETFQRLDDQSVFEAALDGPTVDADVDVSDPDGNGDDAAADEDRGDPGDSESPDDDGVSEE